MDDRPPAEHGAAIAELLVRAGFSDDMIQAVMSWMDVPAPPSVTPVSRDLTIMWQVLELMAEELEAAGTTDWRTEWWRIRALLLASLYFTLTAAAEFEFKGDLLSKLEAHLVAALGIWFYFAERNRRKDG